MNKLTENLGKKFGTLVMAACIGFVVFARGDVDDLQKESDSIDKSLKVIQDFRAETGSPMGCMDYPTGMALEQSGLARLPQVEAMTKFTKSSGELARRLRELVDADERLLSAKLPEWPSTPWRIAVVPYYGSKYSKLRDHVQERIKWAKSELAVQTCQETPAEKTYNTSSTAASARLHACSTVQRAAADIIHARLSMMIVQRPIVHSLAGNDAAAARTTARSGLGKIAEARTKIAETAQKIKDAQLAQGLPPEFLEDLKTFSEVQLKLADVEVRRAKDLQAYAETGDSRLVLDIVDVDKQLQKSSAAYRDLVDAFQRICSGSPARPK